MRFRFATGQFDHQRFEFDCDTDGGLGVSGDAMAGLVVRVQLVDGTWLQGTLAADPQQPLRAFVHL